jgi:hypothetical protein
VDIEGAGNAAFNAPFVVFELIVLFAWIAALATLRWQRPCNWCRRASLALAIAEAAWPFVYNKGFPPADGIEKLGRLVYGAPLSLVNALLSCTWATLSFRLRTGRWTIPTPYVIAAVVGVIPWVGLLL